MGDGVTTFINLDKTKKLKLAVAVVVLAVSAVALGVSGRVQAVMGGPTCNVPADYPTIQAAVSDAGCTTVKVAPGSYIENVIITHSLALKGAKAGVNVSGRSAAGPNESTVTGTTDTPAFTVNAANVTIDGFSVTNPNHGLGITVKTAGNNTAIKNNIVDNIGNSSYPANGVGIYLELGPDNVRLADNRISNVQSVKSAQGVLVGDSTSGNPSLDIHINGNLISGITSPSKGAYGIQLNNGSSTAPSATGYTTGRITKNTIKNLSGHWIHAIGLEGDTPNIVVKNNIISNLNGATPDKVAVWFEDNIFFFTADVNRNSLDVGASAYGIAVHPALTGLYPTLNVDGICNWWGNKNDPGLVGPGSGSLVGPGVNYSPWLKSSNLNGQCGDKNHDGHDDKDKRIDHDG